MRVAAILILAAFHLYAQFKSTTPLVVAPSTVTDGKGRLIDGLTERDLVFYDNNVPQAIHVDTVGNPISLVVLIEASSKSVAILDKLHRSGVLFTELLAAESGETSLVTFSDHVRVVQDFTSESDRVSHALRNLRADGDGCALLDGVFQALRLLGTRDAGRRRVILVIAERRDRSSKIQLPDLLGNAQLQNTAIYWLTYSTFLTPFTNRPKTVWDRMTDEQKNDPKRGQSGSIKYPLPEEQDALPPEIAPGSLLSIFTELAHRTSVDAAGLLSRTTGGRIFNFLKQSGLEGAIQAVGEEVHQQYIVTFQPKPDTPGRFHAVRAEVKGRPDLQARTRAGYWSVQ